MAQWICIVALALICVLFAWSLICDDKRFETLENQLAAANRSLDLLWGKQGMRDGEVVEAITGNLDAELEKSAVMTEMRQAKRRTLPREDAGPPATVRRMKFYRGK